MNKLIKIFGIVLIISGIIGVCDLLETELGWSGFNKPTRDQINILAGFVLLLLCFSYVKTMEGGDARGRYTAPKKRKKMEIPNMIEYNKLLETIRKHAFEGLDCKGGHHKQYYLEQIIKTICAFDGVDFEILIEGVNFERGIAP
jgi:hypothetical protein